MLCPHIGIGRFHGDAGQLADLAGQGADDVLRGVDGNADDGYVSRVVGYAHAADDILCVGVQYAVDDADDGHSCFCFHAARSQ